MYNNYLIHHGIKGQKWGIRRYQNKNGTLTPEGKEHYYKKGIKKKHIYKSRDGKYRVTKFGADYVNRSSNKVFKPGDTIDINTYARNVARHRVANIMYGIGTGITASGLITMAAIDHHYSPEQIKKRTEKAKEKIFNETFSSYQGQQWGFTEDDIKSHNPRPTGYGTYEEIKD